MVYALCVTVELTSEEHIPAFVDAFEAVHAVSNDPSREPFTQSYELLRAMDCPKTLLILERFRSQSDHKDTHRGSEAFKAFSQWLNGPAQEEGGDDQKTKIVAKVSSRHFLSSGQALTRDDAVVVAPPAVARLSKVDRVVRLQQQAPAAGAEQQQQREQKLKFRPMTDGVLVFGGARDGAKPDFVKAARGVGTAVGRSKRPFLYGGGTVGVMGQAALAAEEANPGCVVGIIPEALAPKDVSGECFGTLVLTQDMNDRKKIMFSASSDVICLPGGCGTLDELFEAITLFQLNYQKHKIALLNVCGFYDPLISLLKSQIAAGFVSESVLGYMLVYDGEPEKILEALKEMPLAEAALKLDWNNGDS